MTPTAFTFLAIALNIGLVSSSCPDNSWTLVNYLWIGDLAGGRICLKGFNTSKSWQEASSTCRRFHGNLLRFNYDYGFIQGYFPMGYKEFWTGMYISKNSFKVPLLDGVPPQRVNATYYNRVAKTWNWANKEPKLDRGCQYMTNGIGNHTAYMESCNRLLPFYCEAPDRFPIKTSLCPNGSLSGGLCYSAVHMPMSYDNAVAYCQQEGGSIAIYDGSNKDILSGTVFNDNFVGDSVVRSYFLNGTTLDGNIEGSGGGDVPVKLCFSLNMGDAYIETIPCDLAIGVICQRPFTMPTASGDSTPIFEIGKVGGEFSEVVTYSMQCRLERTLMDFEKMVTYFNGDVVDAFAVQGSVAATEIIRRGDDYRYIGDYWCELQNVATSDRLVSNRTRHELPQSSSLTYRGYANFTIPQRDLSIALHNLGFLQDSRYRQQSSFVTELFGNALRTAVQEMLTYQDPPLGFTRDFVSGQNEIGKMRDNGSAVEFSVYFIKRSSGLPDNNQWYTLEKDQFALSKLKERIEFYLSFGVPSRRRRRKRQSGGPFLPNVNIFSIGSCSPFSVYDLDLERTVTFEAAIAGDTAYSKELCITDKRPLANVTCRRSFYNGASYGDIQINRKCVFNTSTTSGSTSTLQILSETNVSSSNTIDVLEKTYNLTRVDDLTSLDVIYTASILTNVATSSDQFDQQSVEYSADIVNTMIGLNEDILNQAQDTGSGTNRLVEALEIISNNIVLDATNSASIVRPFVASKIREFSGDTNLVVGLQFGNSPEVTITNSSLKVLEDEMKLDISVTDAAIILPKALLQSASMTRLLLQIYSSTKLFNAVSSNRRFLANSNIAAATLTQDQQNILNLGQYQVKTIFKPFKEAKGLVCGYWDYSKNDNSGGWSTDGCRIQGEDGDRTICVCDHLTNFAILIDFEAQGNYVQAHQLALSVITIIGLVLSIIGLSFTIICFLAFKPLRKTRGQKVLFQLAIAMLCSWIVFLAGVEQTQDYNGCIAVAILLHYFILVTFMWLLIEGILQYLRFVKVLGTYIPRFMLKSTIFAWGVPLIPVIVVCAIDYRLYDGGIHYCWMSLQPFYYAFALPVGLVILTNIIVFILVIVNIVRRPAGLQSNQSERKRALMNFWAALSIFVLLGITWIFGYMAIEDARIPFQYIFTICNAFQGFFIFLLFITRDPQVRKEWTSMCCGDRKKKDHSGYDSSAGSKSKDGTAFTDLSSGRKTSIPE